MSRLRPLIAAAFVAGLTGCGGSTEDPTPNTTVASVTITPSITTMAPGTTLQLSSTARNSAGTSIGGLSTTWTSSNQNVATVSSAGLVTALANGTTTITATMSNVPGTRVITVQTITPVASATVDATAGNVFSPAQVDLTVGGTVTWQFGAVEHNVTFGGGSGAPTSIGNTTNASISRTFSTVGTFPYSCSLHVGMTGTVIVH